MQSAHRSMRGTALVTGASGGIGYEFSKLLARDGYGLVLVARGQDALERVAEQLRLAYGVPVRSIAKDLARPNAAAEINTELDGAGLQVEILVNNAGLGARGSFTDSDMAGMLGMLQLNVVALTQLTRLVLPGMVARRSGKVLNVASTAAFSPGPLMAVYYASKAYVLSFSEGIAQELVGAGVTVTALCPGPTATNFQQRASMGNARLFRGGLTMSPDTVARIGYAGLQSGKRVVIPGLANRLMALGARVAPSRLAAVLAERLHQED
jgi:short-subunit dehydrogenase